MWMQFNVMPWTSLDENAVQRHAQDDSNHEVEAKHQNDEQGLGSTFATSTQEFCLGTNITGMYIQWTMLYFMYPSFL